MASDFSTDMNSGNYSRSRKSVNQTGKKTEGVSVTKLNSPKAKGWHRFLILVFSLVLASLTIAVPALTDLANSIQSQHLYTGLMFSRGHLPYTEIFATGGFLYYSLIALAYHLGSTLWLVVVAFLFFYISGLYLYRIIAYLTAKEKFASGGVCLFYMLNLSLGFGGLYPIQFAMPFVLIALWFLVKYFIGKTTDEAFILYGITCALAILFDARTIIFWLLSLIAIIIYNISQKHWLKGIYQTLCLIFGFLLIIYSVGYFIFNLQITSDYLSETVSYYLTHLGLTRSNLYLTLLFQLVLALASGLVMGLLTYRKHMSGKVSDKEIKLIIFVATILYLIYAVFSRSFDTYYLLYVLPFALILSSLRINDEHELSLTRTSHRRLKPVDLQTKFITAFLTSGFLLPLLAIVYGITSPLAAYVVNIPINTERTTIARYIGKENGTENTIYVWDSSAKIYRQSKTKSASKFVLPTNNTADKTNYSNLQDHLIQDLASYVVVNQSEELPSSVKNNLKKNYDKVSVEKVSHFTIYKKK
ncbi:DUF2079 domain-containing protein [Streptococcus saliviloxodontae]|uniref:Uncharacterized protein YneF (UPF0154 family) n=1 Tax=Streptococcus saliviloxodontae TaxID=1349416 RepID=A0ABS2PNI6_9STRE|nr:DUF2079 domain-containing protein [Streptococcus saliviloxodontae]MBM7636993.1 uncharacterized protein YneF (UPF0154 family) [Streptococcus saliviloxodontae]